MIFAAIPSSQTPPEDTVQKFDASQGKVPVAGSDLHIYLAAVGSCIAAAVVIALVIYLIKRFKHGPKGQPCATPMVHFDRPLNVTIKEEPIEFVLPPLQSPRTFKAGASRFEMGSPEVQKNLYEPIARQYRPPSIGFSVEHDREEGKLKVRLNSAKDLPQSKIGVNPIAKVTLLPDKVKFLSRLQRNTTRPVFGDVFLFDMPDNVPVETKSLKFTVYNQEKLGRRFVIGVALFQLRKTCHQSERWLTLDTSRVRKHLYEWLIIM